MARILVVDDEVGICSVLREALEAIGHFVTVVHNGRDGLQHLMEQSCDLVLLDLRMPVMDGYQMLTSLRQTLKSQVPVLIITGFASLDSVFRCTELGIAGYLHKPFRLDELENKVASVLSGDLSPVGSLSRSARRSLTPREQEVLVQMRQGLTDAEIARKLFISANTAHNHVKRIMSKLNCRNRAEVVALSFIEDVFEG